MFMRRRTERAVGAVAALLGAVFVIAALAFSTDGFAADTARIAPSSIVSGVAGLALLVASAGLFAHRRWGWGADIAGHVLGIGAALLALFGVGVAAGRSDLAGSEMVVPGGMLVLLMISLYSLWRSRPRHPLRRAGHNVAAKMY
jgi:peptidoglycan/LPS O-acetylase OafA/YrhL